jgi:hypothetical protein
MLLSLPASLGFGLAGLVYDKRRGYAIAALLILAAMIAYYCLTISRLAPRAG